MILLCLSMIDDEEDKKSFESLVEKYEKKLYHEAYKILNNHSLAEEALWDAFLGIAKHYEMIKKLPTYKMEAYLVISVKNASYRNYDKEKKHFYDQSLDDAGDIPDDSIFNQFDEVELSEVLLELPEKYKTVLAYLYYYGHSATETAKLMGISRRAVYNYLNRAKEILHTKLTE